MCIYLHVVMSFPHFSIPRISFLELCSEWEKEIHDLGVYGGRFSPYIALKRFVKSHFSHRVFFPICHFRFWFLGRFCPYPELVFGCEVHPGVGLDE